MRTFIFFTICVATFGCSSTATQGDASTASDSGAVADAGTGGDAAVTPDANTALDAAQSLLAPTLVSLVKMTGGLHVNWTNQQKDCDAIEGERKSDGESYKLIFTVPDGSVDNKHDGPLKQGMTYTYRLRCKKGADYSPYSNEMAGSP